MPRLTKEAALEILNTRPLYNVDFVAAKDALNRHFEEEYEEQVRKPFFWSGRYENLPQEVNELDWADWSLHRVPGLQKKVRACKADDPCLTAMILFLNDWDAAAATLAASKKDAIKGRKPSTTPRKSKIRTIENTGTCPCCGRNIKLRYDGKMVDHGFRLQYGFRNGMCPGVGELPWEVSPEGKAKMVKAFLHHLTKLREDVEFLQCEPDADPRQVQRDLARVESEIRYFTRSVELATKEIEAWTKQPLPGTK